MFKAMVTFSVLWIILFSILMVGISIEFLLKDHPRIIAILWIMLSMSFAGALLSYSPYYSYIYASSYILEVSLSLDNILIFLLIFKEFGIELANQEKAIFIGTYSAVFLRLAFVSIGIAILEELKYGSMILSLVVLITAGMMIKRELKEKKSEGNRLLNFVRSSLRINVANEQKSIFIKVKGKIVPTKLLLVIIAIELADILFATDSIPAIVLLSKIEIIAFSSTIFGTILIRSIYLNINKSLINLPHIDAFLAIGLSFLGIASSINSIYGISGGRIGLRIHEEIIALFVIIIIIAGILLSSVKGKLTK